MTQTISIWAQGGGGRGIIEADLLRFDWMKQLSSQFGEAQEHEDVSSKQF